MNGNFYMCLCEQEIAALKMCFNVYEGPYKLMSIYISQVEESLPWRVHTHYSFPFLKTALK